MNITTLNTIGLDGVIIKKGGGGDMPLQDKVVDITENGTTEVLPDSGKALSKVTVNVEVSGGGAEEKFGMIYIHKKGILRMFDVPEEIDVPQEELMGFMLNLLALPIVALKGAPANANRINDYITVITDEIPEGRFTWEALSYVALNLDAITLNKRMEVPAWTFYGSSIDEARTVINSILTEQITKEEFYNLD